MLRIIPSGLFKNIRGFKPDIVLVPECGLIPLLLVLFRFLTNAPFKIISMIDDSYDMVNGNQFSKKHEWAERLLIPCFDNIINVDERTTSYIREKYSKGLYFPIIYDEAGMRERYQRILPVSEGLVKQYGLNGKRVALFVGRMVGLKNIPTLIDAFKRIADSDCRLVLVGNGECLDDWSNQTSDDKRIIFAGRYEGDELYAWYNIAGVFVLPSIQEPFGAVVTEALLGGCWCIVSEKAGSQCLIESGYNGTVLQPKDKDKLYQLLSEALLKQPILSLPLCLRKNLVKVKFKDEIKRIVKDIS